MNPMPTHSQMRPAIRAGLQRLRRDAEACVWLPLCALLVVPLDVAAQDGTARHVDRFIAECPIEDHDEVDHLRFSDRCIPLDVLPRRPRPLLELGEPFLTTGTLARGIRMPGGAVWQPAFLAFGEVRTAVQGGRFGDDREIAEAAARFDLFGNLYLTQTERVVVGLRPLDQNGRFTRYTFRNPDPEAEEEGTFTDELNSTVSTLFFEGDILSLIPSLDRRDTRGLDIYFSVGRQPLAFQDGLLINEDIIDMVGLTRANMKILGTANTRITGVYAWGGVTRQGMGINRNDDDGGLFGLFTEIDIKATTLEFDAVYTRGGEEIGDGIHVGAADIRRIGRFNNTFRVLGSLPIGDETPFNSRGVLFHNQLSWTPNGNHNFWYIGSFVGLDRFRSAARGPGFGGPVGQTGILFAAPGLGRVGAAIGSVADEAAGASIGYQMFFGHTRQQLLLEVGGRKRFNDDALGRDLLGGGARYQMAMGRRMILLLDGTAAYDLVEKSTASFGRFELLLRL
jgi:hypothetical protein